MAQMLGIDVGTTAVKAAVIGPDGAVVRRFSQEYPTRRCGGGVVEQDPDDWVRLMEAALAAFEGEPVEAAGLTSQVNTHVFVGADGRPLMPAILWQDTRAEREAAALDARVSPEERTRWWGAPMPIDASHALSRMAWVARHRPEVWQATRWVLLPKDYCLMALTGEVASDPLSNIGLVGPDLAHLEAALALVPGARQKVAPLVGITEEVGRVRAGPFAGTPVVAGTMDAWAGLVGAGAAREGASVYLSGTSEILGISSSAVIPTPGAIVFPAASGVRLHAAPTQSGGDAVRWFCEVTGLTLEAMAERVAQTPRSARTPVFLPQLEGERAPLWDASLRAAFLGVSRGTGLSDFARAVYEGVAFAARHALETLHASSGITSEVVFCGGGGFRSDAWARVRADVLGVPLRTLAADEPGVLGAATLAAVGRGHFASLEEAHEGLARFCRTFEPDPGAHARMSEIFGLYKEAQMQNAKWARRLGSITASARA